MKLPLSVLDLSPVGAGVAASQAVRDSIALARVAEDGSPATVAAGLYAAAKETRADEIMLSSLLRISRRVHARCA